MKLTMGQDQGQYTAIEQLQHEHFRDGKLDLFWSLRRGEAAKLLVGYAILLAERDSSPFRPNGLQPLRFALSVPRPSQDPLVKLRSYGYQKPEKVFDAVRDAGQNPLYLSKEW